MAQKLAKQTGYLKRKLKLLLHLHLAASFASSQCAFIDAIFVLSGNDHYLPEEAAGVIALGKTPDLVRHRSLGPVAAN